MPFLCSLRWPTTVTSKPCAHSKLQIAHIKFKSLTANSNNSQEIQIAHSELQITHSKLQIAHSKFKWPTANSNRSQQIKVAHSKFKLRLRLSTASGATHLKIFVIYEAATLESSYVSVDGDAFRAKDQLVPDIMMFEPHPTASKLSYLCLLYTSPSPRDLSTSRMPSSA